MGGAGCGSGGGVWGNGFTSLRRVVFSFVTVSRASLFLYVRVTVSSLVLSFLFSGFYIRLLHCAEFPLTHARPDITPTRFYVRLLHGFYVRCLHCAKFPLAHARAPGASMIKRKLDASKKPHVEAA